MRKLGKIKLKNKSGKLFMQFFCFSRFLSNIFFKIHCHWMKIFPFGVQEKCFLLSFQNHHNTSLAVCQKLQSTPDNSNLQGKSKKVRVIGSSKKIAESKVKNGFYYTVNILITFNCRNVKWKLKVTSRL